MHCLFVTEVHSCGFVWTNKQIIKPSNLLFMLHFIDIMTLSAHNSCLTSKKVQKSRFLTTQGITLLLGSFNNLNELVVTAKQKKAHSFPCRSNFHFITVEVLQPVSTTSFTIPYVNHLLRFFFFFYTFTYLKQQQKKAAYHQEKWYATYGIMSPVCT